MCVLVDRTFFDNLGRMESVDDVSNCDIAWFVVKYEEDDAGTHLSPDLVHFTTLGISVTSVEIYADLLRTLAVPFDDIRSRSRKD